MILEGINLRVRNRLFIRVPSLNLSFSMAGIVFYLLIFVSLALDILPGTYQSLIQLD